ncbi:MAG: glycosyltransferase family 9 protein [Candidatus Abyssobacteria bacterium SURF_5]|uniref:Glycosyltransferase family 9 protein n=1 Tax=Abyssobacteria bacterium (strain SURF_5) TaxID=2093360 RepID=A0A3A4P2C2_ABYX5|nr:MAG: glycosyltransferase family 9 protein [Candidatus Abyssubacteria bacterium SURF_5]
MHESQMSDPKTIIEAYEAGRIRRILLIRVSRVGDLIFTTPSIRRLKARFPKAEFHFLTNAYSQQVLQGNPHISRVHLMDRKSIGWRLFGLTPAAAALRKAGIDLVIPFRWRNEYKPLFKKIEAPFVYRLTNTGATNESSHVAERLLDGLAPLGVEPDDRGMEVFFGEDEKRAVDEFLARLGLEKGPVVVLHPGCHQTRKARRGGSAAKRIWPAAHWAELVQHLHRKNGSSPILTGFSGGDIAGNEEICRISGLYIPQFTGGSLNGLAALLARADAFVCGDTGPLHVASAVSAPTVALFGPSRPEVTGPYRNRGGAIVLQKQIECVPCKGNDIKCSDNKCMKQISVQDVCNSLSQFFETRTQP